MLRPMVSHFRLPASSTLFCGLISLFAASCTQAEPAAPPTRTEVKHASRWLVATGAASGPPVTDAAAWVSRREAFIRTQSEQFAHLKPLLPVRYLLDEDYVVAARRRRSIAVADACGREICGVATEELPREWDRADVRALFTSPDDPPLWRDAFTAALLKTFEGEDLDAWTADLVRAGLVPDGRKATGDFRVIVPVLASLIRYVDSAHALALPKVRERVEKLTDDDERRWREALLARPRAERRPSPPPRPVRGAVFSVINRLESHIIANVSHEALARLQRLGFDSISLVPYGGQRGFDGTEIRRFDGSPASESDLSMALGASRAHRLGMRVMLKPHIWTEGTGGGDPTRIVPKGDRWDLWFASYRDFLIHHALLARAIDAEWLSIGTELSCSEFHPEWRSLIALTRSLYRGQITYSSNFDAFERTPFWRDVDAIGVDAYFPLASAKSATDAQLRRGAAAAVARMEKVARETGRPVILTELGYPSTEAPWIQPWSENRKGSAALHDQARAFNAMLSALRTSPHISGFFIWKYESDPAFRDPAGFLPAGKPAEDVIATFLK